MGQNETAYQTVTKLMLLDARKSTSASRMLIAYEKCRLAGQS